MVEIKKLEKISLKKIQMSKKLKKDRTGKIADIWSVLI